MAFFNRHNEVKAPEKSAAAPAGTPAPVVSPVSASTQAISRIEDLPAYARFDEVEDKASNYAALLITDDNVAYLAIRDDLWMTPAASTLRVALGRETRYRQLICMRVTAGVMSHLKTGAGNDQPAEGAGPRQIELHVARALEMVSRAISLDASDIHLEIRTSGRDSPAVVQRMRMNGVLQTMLVEKTVAAVEAWTEVVRGLYQNDEICPRSTRTSTTWSASQKQEGMLKPPVRNAEIRFESLPEKGGFDVVLRINGYEGKSAARKSLAELGLSEEHALDLMRASLAPHGLVVVVGATGSGKTTTVTTTLALDSAAEGKKRISLEIPPESDIPWLSQLVVTADTMQSIMDGVMRADPDVISGGEVRNRETGQMAQDFSITGHLTWVTVHANSAFLAIRRLVSDRLGFDIDILTMRNFLRAALYQALVEKLCPDCSLPAEQHLAEDKLALLAKKFDLDTKKLWVRHQHDKASGEPKCPRCNGLGVLGRTVVCELVVPSVEVLTLLRDGQVVRAEGAWRATREARFDEPGTKGKTYVEHAIYKATQREVCAQSLFFLENLWNYEVVGLKSHAAGLASADKGDRGGASVLSLDQGRVGKVAGAGA